MPAPPADAPSPAAAPLVATSRAHRDARARDRPRDGSRADAPRVGPLWEAIRRTRLELEARERRDAWIGARFEALIRPRERAFTTAVCRLTERLVSHHERTALGGDERSLLGLWINENLQGLATHPFAPRDAADALARRWRGHLGAGAHPLDGPLANLHARAGRDDAGDHDRDRDADADDGVGRGGGERTARPGARAERGRAPRRRPDRRRDGGERNADRARGGGRDDRRDGERDDPRDDGGPRASDAADGRDPGRLVARLFRRLARVLHPDREPDEARRRDKHALMSDCLRARAERDIDTLLSLYVEHVGALPRDVVDDDPAELVALLRRQLAALQGRLRRQVAGDGLEAMIVARYAADVRAESERRFAAHADALDTETARVDALARDVADADGLRAALATRRALELDRLAIDELTGVAIG